MKTIRLLISLMAPERKDSLNLNGLSQLMNSKINRKIIIISLFNNFITHQFKSSRLFIRVYISPILTNVNVNFIGLNESWTFLIKKYHNRQFFNKLNRKELKKSKNTKIYSIKISENNMKKMKSISKKTQKCTLRTLLIKPIQ